MYFLEGFLYFLGGETVIVFLGGFLYILGTILIWSFKYK